MVLTFYISVAKELKLKVRKFWGLIPTFLEVTRKKMLEGGPYPTMIKLGSCTLSKNDAKININHVTPLLNSTDFSIVHRKSAVFAISRNTDIED